MEKKSTWNLIDTVQQFCWIQIGREKIIEKFKRQFNGITITPSFIIMSMHGVIGVEDSRGIGVV